MKVIELIEELQKLSPHCEVLVYDDNYGERELANVHQTTMRKNKRGSEWVSPWRDCKPNREGAQDVVVIS